MEDKTIIIDYISATHPIDLVEDENERVKVFEYVEAWREFLKISDFQIEESSYALNRFRYQYIFSDYIILRLVGPQNEFGMRTCQIELKGEGCREFERLRPDLTWVDFFKFLISFNATFKRIDVTIDDKSGNQITIDEVFNKVKNEYYTSIFKSQPKYHGILDTGLTIDLGSRKSLIELCIYDKLKQQKALNKEIEETYWCRYEMRFRQEKANQVVFDLIRNYKNEDVPIYGMDIKSFAIKSLYAILDLKVDNNYDKGHQNMLETDPKWLSFLEATEKGILPKTLARKSNTESRYNYIMPKAKLIILQWLMETNFDSDMFLERVLNEELDLLKNTTRTQLYRFNQYLDEKNQKRINFEQFDELISNIDRMLDERSLPF